MQYACTKPGFSEPCDWSWIVVAQCSNRPVPVQPIRQQNAVPRTNPNLERNFVSSCWRGFVGGFHWQWRGRPWYITEAGRIGLKNAALGPDFARKCRQDQVKLHAGKIFPDSDPTYVTGESWRSGNQFPSTCPRQFLELISIEEMIENQLVARRLLSAS